MSSGSRNFASTLLTKSKSTAIYSGLLRFADLTILAPNTIYPMFIVAQSARSRCATSYDDLRFDNSRSVEHWADDWAPVTIPDSRSLSEA